MAGSSDAIERELWDVIAEAMPDSNDLLDSLDGVTAETVTAVRDAVLAAYPQLRGTAALVARLRAGARPLDVACDECGAKPGKVCYGNGPMYSPHGSRSVKAQRTLMSDAIAVLEG